MWRGSTSVPNGMQTTKSKKMQHSTAQHQGLAKRVLSQPTPRTQLCNGWSSRGDDGGDLVDGHAVNLAVDLGGGAVTRDVTRLAAAIAGLAGSVQGTTVRGRAVS